MRGFTMFLVVFGHMMTLGAGIKTYETSLVSFFITFRMPLFFFISGFIAYKAVEFFTVGNYAKRMRYKAFVQLVPTAILFSVYQLAFGKSPLSFFSHGLGGYWFTLVLFEFFVVYFSVSLLAHYMKRHWLVDVLMLMLCPFLFAGFFAVTYLHVKMPVACDVMGLDFFCEYFQFFVVGVLCRKYESVFYRLMKKDGLFTFAVAVFVLSFLAIRMFPTKIPFILTRDIIVRYAGLFTVVGIFVKSADYFNRDGRVSRAMQYVGRRTLDIYLLHYFLIPDLSFARSWFVPHANEREHSRADRREYGEEVNAAANA